MLALPPSPLCRHLHISLFGSRSVLAITYFYKIEPFFSAFVFCETVDSGRKKYENRVEKDNF